MARYREYSYKQSLETTKRYLEIEIGDLKKMHALYHPREHEHRLGGPP